MFSNSKAVSTTEQIKQFQSLYYLIKGKRDTDIKLFTKYKEFNYSDIIELNTKIYKKLELHKLVTDIVNVTIGFDNKEIKSLGNWNEFTNTDFGISACTKYITLEWDFNLILPNQTHEVPQTHTIRVRIGNSLKTSEIIQVVFQGGEAHDLEEAQAQMSCKIDFVNSQICNELKTIVSEWYDTLKNNSHDHKLIKFIVKHKNKFHNFIIISFLTAGTILINYLYSILSSSSLSFLPKDDNHKLFFFLTSSVLVLFLFYRMGSLYANQMLRQRFGKLRRNPMFTFTKGDKNKFNDVKKNNKKQLEGVFKTIILSISANGLTTLIGYILSKIIT